MREERVEPYQVRVCRMEEKQETINVSRTVCHKVPVTYTYRVPRTIRVRVPLSQPCCGVSAKAEPEAEKDLAKPERGLQLVAAK